MALAEHYHVDNLLRPIFDFEKGETSPPLAPKHVTAASSRPRKIRTTEPKRKKIIVKHLPLTDEDHNLSEEADRHHHHHHLHNDLDVNSFSLVDSSVYPGGGGGGEYHNKKKRPRPILEGIEFEEETDDDHINSNNPEDDAAHNHDRTYAQKLLQYFISDDSGIPAILLRPPVDLDVNVIIDDEGHTSLHWAAAMGRLKLVSILIELGADIYRVNYKGQTALMRSVLFTNNFDAKSFLFLIDMLKKTIFNIDKKDQTVFHHVSATASWKGKVHASRYYMECLIETLSMNQSELISILNVQDVYGDTALSIAARIGNKKLVRLLMEAGASAEIANEDGMTAQDYLSEVERNNRFQPPSQINGSPTMSNSDLDSSQQHATRSGLDHKSELAARTKLRQTVEGLFKQILVNDRSHPPVVSQMFDGFAGNYERELIQKDHLIKEKNNELELSRKRLLGTKHTSEQIQFDPTRLEFVDRESTKLASIMKKQTLFIQKEHLSQLITQNEKEIESSAPTEEESVDDLLMKLKSLQESRKKLTEKLMEMRLKTPSKRHQEYKRLISMCCNVSYENVDLMLLPLLSSFDELGAQTSLASSPLPHHPTTL